MSSSTEQIKNRLDIVSVVGSYLTLVKSGKNLKARCPFHNERTPSFIVSPDRNTYHCFGCGKGGDIFSFVEEIEGVDFKEALTTLASKAGVDIGLYDPKEKSEQDILRSILFRAAAHYQYSISLHKPVLDYLLERGLSKESISHFTIGYVPDEWEWTRSRLIKEGYSDTLLEKAGLVIRGERGFYDRFRGRIMFPIKDSMGRIIGFSGRIFNPSDIQTKVDVSAKYINSPATVLYDKSRVLYGYDTAKDEIRKTKTCVVVEGQMDVLLSQQAGVFNTVAASGTALTEKHLQIISRLADTVILVFDADDAGFFASNKSASLALSNEMNVLAAALPKGMDPADIASANPKEWASIIKESYPIIDFYLKAIRNMDISKEEKSKKIEEIVFPYIAKIPNRITQARHISKAALDLAVSEEIIFAEIKRRLDFYEKKDTHSRPNSQTRRFVSSREIIETRLMSIIAWKSTDSNFDVSFAIEKYIALSGKQALDNFDAISPTEKNKLILKAEFSLRKRKKEDIIIEIKELLKRLEIEGLSEKVASIMEQLKKVRAIGDLNKEALLMKEVADIRQKQEQLIITEKNTQ